MSVIQVEQIDGRIESLKGKYRIPGVAVAIAKDGKPVYEKGFGHRNIRQEQPVTMDTVFGVASITKSFVCVAIMQLQEAGKLNVHDPVVDYLPAFQVKNGTVDSITIHHLMTHTSGLPPLPTLFYAGRESRMKDPSLADYPGLKFQSGDDGESIETYDQLLRFISQLDFDLLGEPGTEFSYSNDGYAMLGMIIEAVSHETFEGYLRKHVFEPLQMNHSCVLIDDLKNSDEVTMLYSKRKTEEGEEVYEAPIWWDSPAMRGAGAVKSTVRDLLKYAEIYRTNGISGGRRILSEASVEAMTSCYIECSPGQFYGYGLMVTPDFFGSKLIQHSGNSKAIASHMCIIPERGITGAVLTNLAGVPAPTILEGAINLMEGREFDAFPVEAGGHSYTDRELSGYTGRYVSSEGMELAVAQDGTKLLFEVPGEEQPIQAAALSEDVFLIYVRDQAEIVQFKWKDGQVERVFFHHRQFPKTKS
ncbi:serine hydrolase domain-containing protein [Bhargavaea ullalensis]|uniref:CubicO group peptidase (Beta-lactamase class C family) n=1 Tax=Bhargavaea ullalensis TaxID=1265685 RepID=A0ABV2GCW4_9BACL